MESCAAGVATILVGPASTTTPAAAGGPSLVLQTGKKESLRMSVPFLTNAESMSLGDRLWVRPNALSLAQAADGAKATHASSA